MLEVYGRLVNSHLSDLSDKCITGPLIFYAGAKVT